MSTRDSAAQPGPRHRPQSLESEFLNEYAAAALLNISVRTVRRWRSEGRGPPFMKFSGAVRYKRATLLAWAEAQVREPMFA